MKIKNLDREAPYLDLLADWLFDEWGPISPFAYNSEPGISLSDPPA